jgi:hypothetical protein
MAGNWLHIGRALLKMLNACTEYGVRHDVQYNSKKSSVIICRAKGDKDLLFPQFYLSGEDLCVSYKGKYLGHFITDQMRDDDDTLRQCRTLYAQANMFGRKFYMCSDHVKKYVP